MNRSTACRILLTLFAFILVWGEARAADPITSIAPAAESLGPKWTRSTALLIEDLDKPPQPPRDQPEGAMAAEMLEMVLPLLKKQKVKGAGNFMYEAQSADAGAVLDLYLYRFETAADAEQFQQQVPKREGRDFGVGEGSRLSESAGTKLLTFRRGSFYIKCTVLGEVRELKKFAKRLDASIIGQGGGR